MRVVEHALLTADREKNPHPRENSPFQALYLSKRVPLSPQNVSSDGISGMGKKDCFYLKIVKKS